MDIRRANVRGSSMNVNRREGSHSNVFSEASVGLRLREQYQGDDRRTATQFSEPITRV
jgi:hypothetical protein